MISFSNIDGGQTSDISKVKFVNNNGRSKCSVRERKRKKGEEKKEREGKRKRKRGKRKRKRGKTKEKERKKEKRKRNKENDQFCRVDKIDFNTYGARRGNDEYNKKKKKGKERE